MKEIIWDVNDVKQRWKVKDDFESGGTKRIDRLGYQYTIELIAQEHLIGKEILELYGGVGMSSHRYARHVKSVTRIDIDNECNKLARSNLKSFNNIKFIEGDFIEEMKKLKRKFDFIDADGYTKLDVLFVENFDLVLNLLKPNAIGFYTTNNYQFVLSRNFKRNYKNLEEKLGIKFKGKALKNPVKRSEIFHKAFAKALENKSNGKYICCFIYLRANISHMLFLRSDLAKDLITEKVYKTIEVSRLVEKIMTKPIELEVKE